LSPALIGSTSEFDDQTSAVEQRPAYLKGVHWSPDGNCLLTASSDATLQVFQIQVGKKKRRQMCFSFSLICYQHESSKLTLHRTLKVKENELVYSYQWFPQMTVTGLDKNTPLFHIVSFTSAASKTQTTPVVVFLHMVKERRSICGIRCQAP
jgi:WD40 repeat protein